MKEELGKMSSTMSIEWHKNCLKNMRNYLNQRTEEYRRIGDDK
jgi:hypothetical protein